jgi:nucleoside-diphosphate-sugar epimerase
MIRWITRELGTGARETIDEPGVDIVDVRHLVDKGGNSEETVRSAVAEALKLLAQGSRVVVCCDYGMSRSNSIAAGVLAIHKGISFSDAVREVIQQTGERAIRLEVLSAVEDALDGLAPALKHADSRDRESILITGGSGFIGRALIPQLSADWKIIAPGSTELDLTQGPAQLGVLAREEGISQVVHLANPRVYSTNAALGPMLVSLKNVVDVCLQQKIRLIFISSWEIYSAYRSQLLRANESLPANPKGPYGMAKYLCERMLEQEKAIDPGFRYSIIRSSPVYGAGSDRPRFIYRFIDLAERGEDIVTHRYTNGLPIVELTHVSDFVTALAAVIETGATGTFNVGSGTGVSTAAVAEMIVALTGSRSSVRHADLDEFAPNVVMDSARARSVLGWRPVADIMTELRSLVSMHRPEKSAVTRPG